MAQLQKSVLTWHSCEQMFALVADVPRYPEFMPWCSHGAIHERSQKDKGNGHTKETVLAELGIGFMGIKQSFSTRNVLSPHSSIHMEFVSGPFSSLQGLWMFDPLSAVDTTEGCRVSFNLQYEFASAALATVIGPVFRKVTDSFVDAFVKRAEVVYG